MFFGSKGDAKFLEYGKHFPSFQIQPSKQTNKQRSLRYYINFTTDAKSVISKFKGL